MLPASIKIFIESELSIIVDQSSPVSGGSINDVYCLHITDKKYLLKVNNKAKFPDMFSKEAIGLETIADTHSIAVPQIIMQDDVDDHSFLLLEWIANRRPTASGSILLGTQLAKMHRSTSVSFGFDGDNYMGSLSQSNKKHDNWSGFFIQERLRPMVELAARNHLLDKNTVDKFDSLYQKLPGYFSEEPPALLHGDLWSGNYLISEANKPYLIDPAVCYGHREVDIAMTTLFGGFREEFYTAYNESFPLAKGWQRRVDLWNLYPLLIHLNLFGTSYLGQITSALAQFV